MVIVSQFQAFQVISECSRMVPKRPKPFSERSGAVEVRKCPIFFSKIFVIKKLFGQKIICWGCSETVFAGFPGHGGPILNCKRSFKVYAAAERSEVRAKRGSSSLPKICCNFVLFRKGVSHFEAKSLTFFDLQKK